MSNRFEKKSKLTLFVILAISILLLLIVFEKLVGISLGHKETDTRYIRLRENAPFLDWKLTPSDVELKLSENLENKAYPFATDKNGFILPSLTHENPNTTLAFIGGSTTECMYVNAEKRFHFLVSNLLSTENYKVNTLNAGVSGNDSLHSINAYLNKIISSNPNYAILLHNINDLSTLLHEGSYWNKNTYRSPIVYEKKSLKSFVKAFLPNSYELLHRIKSTFTGHIDEFAHDRNKTKTFDEQNIYRLFEDNLELFIAISHAKNIQPVLMTQASRFTETPDQVVLNSFKKLESLGINYRQFKQLFDGMNQVIRKVASNNNIVLIDLAKEIPPTKKYIVDTVHFNDEGSNLVATIIANKLKPLISTTDTNK